MITLTPKPLNELALLTADMNVQLRKQAKQLDESWPGWREETGLFVIKAHVTADECAFAFAESDGHVFHVWQRPWRCLTFLRFDAAGMGYAYHDDEGLHEVRFVAD